MKEIQGKKLIFLQIFRVVLAMDTKITLQRKKFLMRHIKRMELHYFESRALDLIICKQYKLKQYVFFSPSLYF